MRSPGRLSLLLRVRRLSWHPPCARLLLSLHVCWRHGCGTATHMRIGWHAPSVWIHHAARHAAMGSATLFVLLHHLFVFSLFFGALFRRQEGQDFSARLNGGHP